MAQSPATSFFAAATYLLPGPTILSTRGIVMVPYASAAMAWAPPTRMSFVTPASRAAAITTGSGRGQTAMISRTPATRAGTAGEEAVHRSLVAAVEHSERLHAKSCLSRPTFLHWRWAPPRRSCLQHNLIQRIFDDALRARRLEPRNQIADRPLLDDRVHGHPFFVAERRDRRPLERGQQRQYRLEIRTSHVQHQPDAPLGVDCGLQHQR